MRKNRTSIFCFLNCTVIVIFLITVGIISIFHEKPSYSELERRDLKTFPKFSISSYFDGSFTKDLSAYFADVFPMRESLVKLSGTLNKYKGIVFDDIRIHNVTMQETSSAPASGSSSEIPAESSEASAPQEDTVSQDSNDASAIRNGAIYVYKGKAFSIYSGNASMGKYYSDVVNKYQEVFGDKVKIYNLIVPSSIEFGLPSRYRNMTAPQKESIEGMYSYLDDKVIPVRVYDTLKEHKDEYIFFGTDHHWTSLGAYYAYCEFCKAAGLEPVDITKLPKKTLENFVGTLYGQTNDPSLLENPDHVDYYEMTYPVKCYQYRTNSPDYGIEVPLYGEYALPANSYSVYLHGDFPLTKIVTGNKNGKKIAVIKESYGNAFSPFLANNYEEIYVVDERYFQTDMISLVEENSIDEILIINNIFAANTPYHANNILRIIDQPYVPYIPPEEPKEEVKAEEQFDPEDLFPDEDDD